MGDGVWQGDGGDARGLYQGAAPHPHVQVEEYLHSGLVLSQYFWLDADSGDCLLVTNRDCWVTYSNQLAKGFNGLTSADEKFQLLKSFAQDISKK